MHKYMSMKVYTIEFAIRECLSISIKIIFLCVTNIMNEYLSE